MRDPWRLSGKDLEYKREQTLELIAKEKTKQGKQKIPNFLLENVMAKGVLAQGETDAKYGISSREG